MEEIERIEYYKDNGKWYKKTFYKNVIKPDVEKVKTPLTLRNCDGDIMIVLEDEE